MIHFRQNLDRIGDGVAGLEGGCCRCVAFAHIIGQSHKGDQGRAEDLPIALIFEFQIADELIAGL